MSAVETRSTVSKLNSAQIRTAQKSRDASQEAIAAARSRELFFAVCAPVGAGPSRVAQELEKLLAGREPKYEVQIFKASTVLAEWAKNEGHKISESTRFPDISRITQFQEYGNEMRQQDKAAVAVRLIEKIQAQRAAWLNRDVIPGQPVEPDGSTPRAYIIDSIRHPAEANLFRRVYGDAFVMIGVVCEKSERRTRLMNKHIPIADQTQNDGERIDGIMERDEDESAEYGQHVRDVFHTADFFFDNSVAVTKTGEFPIESLERLVKIIEHKHIVRPSIDETAMHHAHSAMMRSACFSRQVGASLIDEAGNVVATGTNEVPRAGGGVYGESSQDSTEQDHRCFAVATGAVCSNNVEQNDIIRSLITDYPALVGDDGADAALVRLRKSRLGSLLEFSRSVHAEMDAVLSAGRVGVSTVNCRLFVTTFPCHYCARHIVSAGISEVQFIEPYPKSLAINLHKDSITIDSKNWINPATRYKVFETKEQKRDVISSDPKVLFRPFVGVAPRLYERAFLKDREYKDKVTGAFRVSEPDWGSQYDSLKLSYPALESTVLAKARQ
jgi:deoxycytidylate deaminase